jgi:hypothetical protein
MNTMRWRMRCAALMAHVRRVQRGVRGVGKGSVEIYECLFPSYSIVEYASASWNAAPGHVSLRRRQPPS